MSSPTQLNLVRSMLSGIPVGTRQNVRRGETGRTRGAEGFAGRPHLAGSKPELMAEGAAES